MTPGGAAGCSQAILRSKIYKVMTTLLRLKAKASCSVFANRSQSPYIRQLRAAEQEYAKSASLAEKGAYLFKLLNIHFCARKRKESYLNDRNLHGSYYAPEEALRI